MNGSTNYELAKAMISDRQQSARREGERARLVSEAREAARHEAARHERASGTRPGTVIARVRALLGAPAA